MNETDEEAKRQRDELRDRARKTIAVARRVQPGRQYLDISVDAIEGKLGRVPIGLLESVMLFPDMPERRKSAIDATAALAIAEILEVNKVQTIGTDLGKAIWSAPKKPNFDGDMKVRVYRGLIGGSVVIDMIEDKNLQLEAAIGKWTEHFEKKGIASFKRGTFRTTVWPHLRHVGHLWAAYVLKPRWGGSAFPCSIVELPMFLAQAEAVRHLGETRRLARQNLQSTLLDPTRTLTVPDKTARALPTLG
jgi:hypothetical protein